MLGCWRKDDAEALVCRLIVTGVLREYFQHTAYSTNAYVDEGQLAAGVRAGRVDVSMTMDAAAAPAKQAAAAAAATAGEREEKNDKNTDKNKNKKQKVEED